MRLNFETSDIYDARPVFFVFHLSDRNKLRIKIVRGALNTINFDDLPAPPDVYNAVTSFEIIMRRTKIITHRVS